MMNFTSKDIVLHTLCPVYFQSSTSFVFLSYFFV